VSQQEDAVSATFKLTVREEVDRSLAALTPEKFILPLVKRNEKMHFACMATDEIKRLFTLCEQLANKYAALQQKARELARDAKERIIKLGSRDECNREIKTPGSQLSVIDETMKNIEREQCRTDLLGRFINTNLYLEIISQHTDLENKTDLHICDDWSLCWEDGSVDPPAPVITRLVFRAVPTGNTDESGGRGEQIPKKHTLH